VTYLAGLVRAKPWCQKRWNARRGTRTTPWYSPISTPNSTACRSAFQRVSWGEGEEHGASKVPLGLTLKAAVCLSHRLTVRWTTTPSVETVGSWVRPYSYTWGIRVD
jgi:hypothetical protein